MHNLPADVDYTQVPGAAITDAERDYLRRTASNTMHNFYPTPITIVNLGVMWGATMWCLRDGAPQARLVGVDINIDRDDAHTVYHKSELHAEFIEADSTTYTKFCDPIHLLFIDGCHHEHTVSADITVWSPHVVVGSIMAFHDYAPSAYDFSLYPDLIGVRRAVDKWKRGTDEWKQVASVDSIIAFERIRKYAAIPLHNPAEVQWRLHTPQAVPA